ncbi:MAG: extracellular solute-binding protein [Chloroflexi bacterium]|nr:extracellular solute-binding protein [Chloroflexota bacterium]
MARMTRRRYLGWAALTLGGVAAVACGRSAAPGSDQTQPPPQSKESVTLDFQHRWDGAQREPLVVEQIRAFEQKYPHITVNVTMNLHAAGEGVAGGVPIGKILAAIAAGTPPDVLMIHANDALGLTEKGALTYLDPFLTRDKISLKDVYFPAALTSIQVQGKTFALTQTAAGDNPYLFYSKTLLAAAGVDPKQLGTWDGLITSAKTLTKPAGDGFSQIGIPLPGGAFMDWQTVNGGELITKDGRKPAFNTAAGRETLTFMTESIKSVYGTPQRMNDFLDQYKSHPRGGGNGAWVAQKSAMFISGPWVWFETQQQVPTLEFAGIRLPVNKANPQSKQTTIAESVWTWAMGAGLKKPDESWRLEKWMSLEEGHKRLMIGMGRATMVKAIVQDKAFFDQNPGWSVVLETLNAATGVPLSKGWAPVKTIANRLPSDVLSGKYGVADALLQGEREAQATLDEAYRAG